MIGGEFLIAIVKLNEGAFKRIVIVEVAILHHMFGSARDQFLIFRVGKAGPLGEGLKLGFA